MPFGFPILVELAGRRCVVIGALPVREHKVEALLAGGATDVLVVALEPEAHLASLATLDGVKVERRSWHPEDLDGAAICDRARRGPDDARRDRDGGSRASCDGQSG